MSSLKGRLIIVVGASSGVGYAAVRRLVHTEEATVVAIARRRVFRIEALAKHARGGQLLALTGDMSVAAQAQSLVGEIHQRFGPIHGLVHAVHRRLRLPADHVADLEFDLTMRVNVKSALHAVQAVSPLMEQQKTGSIVIYNPLHIGSENFDAGDALHAASGRALDALADGWRRRLATAGVTVTQVVVPPGTDSEPALCPPENLIIEQLRQQQPAAPGAVQPADGQASDSVHPKVQTERGGLRLTVYAP